MELTRRITCQKCRGGDIPGEKSISAFLMSSVSIKPVHDRMFLILFFVMVLLDAAFSGNGLMAVDTFWKNFSSLVVIIDFSTKACNAGFSENGYGL